VPIYGQPWWPIVYVVPFHQLIYERFAWYGPFCFFYDVNALKFKGKLMRPYKTHIYLYENVGAQHKNRARRVIFTFSLIPFERIV
jgi:hypothetical protein